MTCISYNFQIISFIFFGLIFAQVNISLTGLKCLLGKLEAQDADVLTLFPLPPPSITADNIISAPTPPLDISTANHLDLFFF